MSFGALGHCRLEYWTICLAFKCIKGLANLMIRIWKNAKWKTWTWFTQSNSKGLFLFGNFRDGYKSFPSWMAIGINPSNPSCILWVRIEQMKDLDLVHIVKQQQPVLFGSFHDSYKEQVFPSRKAIRINPFNPSCIRWMRIEQNSKKLLFTILSKTHSRRA